MHWIVYSCMGSIAYFILTLTFTKSAAPLGKIALINQETGVTPSTNYQGKVALRNHAARDALRNKYLPICLMVQ